MTVSKLERMVLGKTFSYGDGVCSKNQNLSRCEQNCFGVIVKHFSVLFLVGREIQFVKLIFYVVSLSL